MISMSAWCDCKLLSNVLGERCPSPCRHNLPPTPTQALEVCPLHQPLNRFVIHTQPHATQLRVHTGSPVGVLAYGMSGANARSQDALIDATARWVDVNTIRSSHLSLGLRPALPKSTIC
jgi:hypothetical protein